MSNTSLALQETRAWKEHGQLRRALDWATKAQQALPHDLKLSLNITAHLVHHADVVLTCSYCDTTSPPLQSVAQAADFRDRHYYCGEGGLLVPTHTCGTCEMLAYGWETTCRFCGEPLPWEEPTKQEHLAKVHRQKCRYIILAGPADIVASVRCGSLLRARRAARAMFPRMGYRVSGGWGATYPAE